MTEIEKLTEKNKHLQETILAYSARVNMYELKVGRLRRNICKLMNDNEYKTCPDCCYDILDDEGDVMDHECISDNEMIAEFMGADPDKKTFFRTGEYVYFYDTSWDWLMPVVESCFERLDARDTSADEIKRHLLVCNLKGVHQSVVEFIKIHNDEK